MANTMTRDEKIQIDKLHFGALAAAWFDRVRG